MPMALRSELRPPVRASSANSTSWTLTLFPSTHSARSKTNRQDLMAGIGATHPLRARRSQLCPVLLRLREAKGPPTLLQASTREYNRIAKEGAIAAGVSVATPHALRHGGASMDALFGVSDMTIAERGAWRALESVRTYRSGTKYTRRVSMLTAQQLETARLAPQAILQALRRHV